MNNIWLLFAHTLFHIPLPFSLLHSTNLSQNKNNKKCFTFQQYHNFIQARVSCVCFFVGSVYSVFFLLLLFAFWYCFCYWLFFLANHSHNDCQFRLQKQNKLFIYFSLGFLCTKILTYFYLFIVADISQTHAVNECVCVCYTFYLLWQFKELTEVSLIVFEAACQTSLTIHEIFFK